MARRTGRLSEGHVLGRSDDDEMAASLNYQTFSLRVPIHTLERIDRAAQREGVSRNQYVLSWLPEAYDDNGSTHSETQPQSSQQQPR